MTGGVGAAVSAQRSLRVELLEALLVRGNATVSPYLLALKIQRRADAVVTIPVVVGARIPVLLVDVRRALAGLAGAHLRKIAFVGRFPAHDATREQLHNFQNRSRLDPSRGSPKQWSRSSGSSSGEGRKRNLDLPIYLPSSSLYTRAFCPLPFIDAFIVLVAIGHVHLWAERGGGREEDGGVECLTWNVSKIVGPSDRNWKIAERERRGGERRREGGSGMQERNILPYNRCSKDRSRIALRRWVCRWSDRSRGRTRDTPRSIRNHIALPRRLPCFRKISSLRPEIRIFLNRLFVSFRFVSRFWSKINVDRSSIDHPLA